MHWFLKIVYGAELLYLIYTYNHEASHTHYPWVEDVPYGCQGWKVKGQGHNLLITEKINLAHNCFP